MNISGELKASGLVKWTLRGPDGAIKDTWECPNLVTTAGTIALAARMAAASAATAFMPYAAIGSGTTAPAKTDTELEDELVRIEGTTTSTQSTYKNSASFGPGVGTGNVSEACLISASSAGTMFCRQVFTTRPKDAGDTLDLEWSVRVL